MKSGQKPVLGDTFMAHPGLLQGPWMRYFDRSVSTGRTNPFPVAYDPHEPHHTGGYPSQSNFGEWGTVWMGVCVRPGARTTSHRRLHRVQADGAGCRDAMDRAGKWSDEVWRRSS